ncbi:MAG: hypothetical protein IJT98_06100 [Prevotella sp.]|nr:hypothetical protein [Prevotella sp.]
MKKNYIAPQTTVVAVQSQALLINSKSIWSEEHGLGFGGTDTHGTMDPSSRHINDLWDDDDDDDWLL